MTLRTIRLPLALTTALAVNAVACDDIPLQEFEELQARGVIEGQIVYQGPPPCTKDGHVLGAAVLYLWASDGLPPPETFAPSLENFNAVSGDVLFADLVEMLPFNANGDLACPPPGTPSVVASASFVVSPVSAVSAPESRSASASVTSRRCGEPLMQSFIVHHLSDRTPAQRTVILERVAPGRARMDGFGNTSLELHTDVRSSPPPFSPLNL